MKHIQNLRGIFLMLILLAIGCKSNSQEATNTVAVKSFPDKVINPDEVTWQPDIFGAMAEAKSRGELLFVEAFSPTCPHCLALEPFFKMTEVAKKYNTNFINYKLDLTNGEEEKFLVDRNIRLPTWPSFLFFDGEGNLVHQSTVDPNLASINGVADAALDPNQQTGNFKKRFADGERSIDFLANYAAYTRVIQDTTAGITAAAALYEIYPKDKLGSVESWKITREGVSDIDNGFAKYWLTNANQARAFEANAGRPDGAGGVFRYIVQGSLYSPRGKAYSFAKLQEVRNYVGLMGASEFANALLWEFEIKALIKENKLPQALAVGQKMATNFESNGAARVYITSLFTDNFTDNSYIATAKGWLVNALPTINQDNARAEYYYELARINQKLGEAAEAKTNAASAQEFATKAGSASTKFAELIESVK